MNRADDDILIHPQCGKSEKTIPSRGIFLVNPTEARIGMQMLLDAGGERRFLFHSALTVSQGNDFFVAGPAIGAPMAAMTLEKLIALGAKTVLLYGWCGAIDRELAVSDILLGGAAHCGEGTSRYYSTESVCYPSSPLAANVQAGLNLSSPKAIWTTDAPYRESRRMFKELADKYDVSGVDMEYSALCAVAAFRNIDLAALFLVSDELWRPDWRPGFTGKAFKKQSRNCVELLMENIVSFSTLDKIIKP